MKLPKCVTVVLKSAQAEEQNTGKYLGDDVMAHRIITAYDREVVEPLVEAAKNVQGYLRMARLETGLSESESRLLSGLDSALHRHDEIRKEMVG